MAKYKAIQEIKLINPNDTFDMYKVLVDEVDGKGGKYYSTQLCQFNKISMVFMKKEIRNCETKEEALTELEAFNNELVLKGYVLK